MDWFLYDNGLCLERVKWQNIGISSESFESSIRFIGKRNDLTDLLATAVYLGNKPVYP